MRSDVVENRSALSCIDVSHVPKSAPWISFGKSPRPSPLSASLLVTEMSEHVTPGQLSFDFTLMLIGRSLWLIGVRTDGVTDTEHDGRWVSATETVNWQL